MGSNIDELITLALGRIDDAPPDVDVIVEWLEASLERKAAWLREVDEQGVPRRLADCSNYADLLKQVWQDSFVRWDLIIPDPDDDET